MHSTKYTPAELRKLKRLLNRFKAATIAHKFTADNPRTELKLETFSELWAYMKHELHSVPPGFNYDAAIDHAIKILEDHNVSI